MIITDLGTEALNVIVNQPVTVETARWELECISRDHPEYGEVMDGIGRCLCGARYYPEGDAMHYRISRILRDFEELSRDR